MVLSAEQIDAAFDSDDTELQRMVYQLISNPYYSFEPRPDNPADYDEQAAFVESDAKFSICLGGTGSGKTEAAAFKTARYILETPPPRPRVPFWVIGETYEMTCGVCWQEKLSKYIPQSSIFHKNYYDQNRDWPYAVLLKHPTKYGEIGWILEFKSYAQGRERMQAASIGGYWFNEDAPLEIVEEVQGRTRDYDSPGWADFTPIDVKSPEWADRYHKPPAGWRFFHLNTLRNTALVEGWAERFLAGVPEDMRDTRRTGVFASFQGQVFKEWRVNLHICEPFQIPHDWKKIRGIDFGFNNPFCCLWIARNRDGCYFVYDEHFDTGRLNKYRSEQINARKWDYSSPDYGQTYSDHDAQQRAEFAALGIHTQPARKSIEAGIERLRILMMPNEITGEPRIKVFNTCENLIREIPRYRWSKPVGKEGNQKNAKNLPIPFDDHAVDAMRYGIYTEEMELIAGLPQKYVVRKDRSRHGTLVANAERRGYSVNGNGNGNGNGHASGNGNSNGRNGNGRDPSAGMLPY